MVNPVIVPGVLSMIGLDGVGKTRVSNLLSDCLESRGFSVRHVQVPMEPYYTQMKRVRRLGKYVGFVGYALTVNMTAHTLSRNYRRGSLSLCERWFGDTVSSHLAQGVSPKFVMKVSSWLSIPRPEFYILLTCDLDVRRDRVIRFRGSPSQSDLDHFAMDRVLCKNYLAHISQCGGQVIDTTNVEPENVCGKVLSFMGLE